MYTNKNDNITHKAYSKLLPLFYLGIFLYFLAFIIIILLAYFPYNLQKFNAINTTIDCLFILENAVIGFSSACFFMIFCDGEFIDGYLVRFIQVHYCKYIVIVDILLSILYILSAIISRLAGTSYKTILSCIIVRAILAFISIYLCIQIAISRFCCCTIQFDRLIRKLESRSKSQLLLDVLLLRFLPYGKNGNSVMRIIVLFIGIILYTISFFFLLSSC